MSENQISLWYPGPPPETISMNRIPIPDPSDVYTPDNDHAFEDLGVRFVNRNQWHGVSKADVHKCRRVKAKGVEVRRLGTDHFLCGQYGLFATEKFSRFDIIGEYTGKIVGNTANGHYVAALEDKGHNDSLGIDAEKMGNEMRFINSYLNVAFNANVTMRTAYVDTYPRIVIVCMEDLFPGDEILLDYGDSYNKAYLIPSTTIVSSGLNAEEVDHALPFCTEQN
jgi:hypothetical protein